MTLTATLTPLAANGAITFYDGVAVLGTKPVVNGVAALTTSLLPFGSQSLKAYYLGNATYTASASNILSQTVNAVMGNGFQGAVNYSTGGLARSISMSDFNGDGKIDLAVANVGSNNVSILIGNGNGTFQQAVNYATGSGPYSVAVGDFNGDGQPDLAVANTFDGTVSILLGRAGGSFNGQAVIQLPGGGGPISISVADFNLDGKADLVVGNYDNSNVSVLLGNGDGTFQQAANYATGTNAEFVAVADVNGDGKADLVVANLNSNNLSVLINNGNGTFQQAVTYAVGAALPALR